MTMATSSTIGCDAGRIVSESVANSMVMPGLSRITSWRISMFCGATLNVTSPSPDGGGGPGGATVLWNLEGAVQATAKISEAMRVFIRQA